ncbi:MAG TPA: hypothetical protein VLR47_02430, partial [Rhodospirillales bacterium]|nr:hypothetical protein [Rhodospirillales bacterium]
VRPESNGMPVAPARNAEGQGSFCVILSTSLWKARRGRDMALLLEETFGVPAERFLELQKDFELAQARIVMRPDPGRATRALLYGDLPVAEMIKRGWISAESIRDTKNVEAGLMRFFGVNRTEDIEILPHAAKKTAVSSSPTPSQLAWITGCAASRAR